MRVFDQHDTDYGRDAAALAIGVLGGLAVGMALSRPAPRRAASGLGRDLRERVREAGERAKSTARRLQPARLRRKALEQAELMELEDVVLDAFLSDGTLSERGIDVGAISPGIIELSGSVWTDSEADRAVRLASSLPGVRSVINRMDIEAPRGLNAWERGESRSDARWSGHGVGMGRRRQGNETDPDRPDDSQSQREDALRNADHDQWSREGLAARGSSKSSHDNEKAPNRTGFSDDELDNQDPHGQHASRTLDSQPQDLNTRSRVGEGLKSATHLQLEQSDVEAKPHERLAASARDEPEQPEPRLE